jgi:hypothetical protein
VKSSQEYKNKILDRLLPKRKTEENKKFKQKVVKLQKLKEKARQLELEIQEESNHLKSCKNSKSSKNL